MLVQENKFFRYIDAAAEFGTRIGHQVKKEYGSSCRLHCCGTVVVTAVATFISEHAT